MVLSFGYVVHPGKRALEVRDEFTGAVIDGGLVVVIAGVGVGAARTGQVFTFSDLIEVASIRVGARDQAPPWVGGAGWIAVGDPFGVVLRTVRANLLEETIRASLITECSLSTCMMISPVNP